MSRPDLLIRLKKHPDGTATLTCVRADGSATWHRQKSGHAQFFALHDLTHYAVETTLGHRRGFYGLVAEGWDLGDFGTPWPRGPLPADADPAELIVGFLDAERASGTELSAQDLNEKAALYYSEHGLQGQCVVTESDLTRIRARMRELFNRWAAVPPDGVLELTFDRPAPRAEV